MWLSCVLVFAAASYDLPTKAIEVTIEAELNTGVCLYVSCGFTPQSTMLNTGFPIKHRSTASGKRTVLLKQGQVLWYDICLNRDTAVKVSHIVFSNDGQTDTVKVSLGSHVFGHFSSLTVYGGGANWDRFSITNQNWDSINLPAGIYRLRFDVVTSNDVYGIEFDKIVLEVSDKHQNDKILTCSLVCLTDIPSISNTAVGFTSVGWALQRTYPTKCAEEDNVHIPIFHAKVTKYRITATYPKYHSFKNLKNENKANCPFLDYIYWRFTKLDVSSLHTEPSFRSKRAVLTLRDTPANEIHETLLQISIVFPLQGKTKGYIDSEIGAKLFLSLDHIPSEINVAILYKGRTKDYQEFKSKTFSSSSPSSTWDIPDFSWSEKVNNEIVAKVSAFAIDGLQIADLHLERRPMRPDTSQKLYARDGILIEGIDVDFPWRAPETMNVTITDPPKTFDNVDFLRIAVPIPWNGGTGQVLVLYQDGNVRLLPRSAPGLDWIPFGTSVIVGQTRADDFRPSAPIRKVTISPANFTFILEYYDGGKAKMSMQALYDQTHVTVSDITFQENTTQHPFATFRSMYVAEGNSDSDSFMTDSSQVKHVADDWQKLDGTSFFIFRQCESFHLTQSPDLRIDIIEG